jgi:hypothetical protein
MNSEWFTTDQVRQLVELLTVAAAAPDTSSEHRFELDYCRSQLAQQMPAVEVLVLAGVLRETTDRPGADLATRDHCRKWSAYLSHLLGVASTATAATSQAPPASTSSHQPILSAAA